MLVGVVRTELPLVAEHAIVTWSDVAIRNGMINVGGARVAMIRVADAMNHGLVIRDVLAREPALHAVNELFFDRGENLLKPQFQNTAGWNVIYFQSVAVSPEWSERCVEEATVRRLIGAWGEGCAIAVIALADTAATARWSRVGFEVLQPVRAEKPGYAWLDLSRSHPVVRACDRDGDRFEVVEKR